MTVTRSVLVTRCSGVVSYRKPFISAQYNLLKDLCKVAVFFDGFTFTLRTGGGGGGGVGGGGGGGTQL